MMVAGSSSLELENAMQNVMYNIGSSEAASRLHLIDSQCRLRSLLQPRLNRRFW